MASSDPIADMLTIIRNGGKAGFVKVDIPGSKIKLEMVRVLKEQGYIKDFKFLEDENTGTASRLPEICTGRAANNLWNY